MQYAQEAEERAQNEAEANDTLARLALAQDPTDVYYEDDANAQDAARDEAPAEAVGNEEGAEYGDDEDRGVDEDDGEEPPIVCGKFDPVPEDEDEDEYEYEDDDSNPFDDHDQSRVDDVGAVYFADGP